MKGVSSGRVRAAILPALVSWLLLGMSSSAWALGDQWYIGIGGGASILDPTTEDLTTVIEENMGTGGSLFLGADLDVATSVQLQLHSLGEAMLSGGEQADYYAGDASVLYRFVDSRDFAPRGAVFGASLYGRFGLGFLERDSSVNLDKDAPIFFGAGAGVELYLTRNLALRAEGLYLESDASSLGLSLVGRFGGRRLRNTKPPLPPERSFPAPAPAPAPAESSAVATPVQQPPADEPQTNSNVPETSRAPITPTVPLASTESTDTITETASELPETYVPSQPIPAEEPLNSVSGTPAEISDDRDQDGVANDQDDCPGSAAGYPVLGNGCPLLDGVLSGIQFVDNTAELLPGSGVQLDFLATVLTEYPQARVELKAHADNAGDEREQSILTRARLKTVGIYLVREGGIRAGRLLLRSFGSTEPIEDNSTESGRRANNRIEVAQNPR